MLKRNIIERIGDNFQFTKFHKVFLDFAIELIEDNNQEQSPIFLEDLH